MRSPATCRVPIELPGATVAPDWTTVVPTVPLPLSVVPLAIVSAPPSEPLTASVPVLTSVLPVKALLSPVRLSAPAPLLVKLPLPEIALAKVASVACRISSAALSTIAPAPKLPALPINLPAEISVPPV